MIVNAESYKTTNLLVYLSIPATSTPEDSKKILEEKYASETALFKEGCIS